MDRSARADRVYLPLFYDLTDRQVLIVGGGKAAWQKVRALAAFEVPITLVSPEFLPELVKVAEASSHLTLFSRPWDEEAWSTGAFPIGLVLACTDRPEVQAAVVASARRRGVPVLDAADPTAGDFIQPATARSEGFTLAVSSNGTVPRGAVRVRDGIRQAFEGEVRRLTD